MAVKFLLLFTVYSIARHSQLQQVKSIHSQLKLGLQTNFGQPIKLPLGLTSRIIRSDSHIGNVYLVRRPLARDLH